MKDIYRSEQQQASRGKVERAEHAMHERRQTSAAEEANRLSREANRLSWIAIVVAAGALVISIADYFFHH